MHWNDRNELAKYEYCIFWCITRYFLLSGQPGAGYITNAGYTLLNSEIARGFFRIMVKFLLPYIASKRVLEIAATGGA